MVGHLYAEAKGKIENENSRFINYSCSGTNYMKVIIEKRSKSEDYVHKAFQNDYLKTLEKTSNSTPCITQKEIVEKLNDLSGEEAEKQIYEIYVQKMKDIYSKEAEYLNSIDYTLFTKRDFMTKCFNPSSKRFDKISDEWFNVICKYNELNKFNKALDKKGYVRNKLLRDYWEYQKLFSIMKENFENKPFTKYSE